MTLLSLDGGVTNPVLLPCLEGCLSTATLNLIYWDFIDDGSGTATLVFDPTDPRSLLYQVTDKHPGLPEDGGYDARQSYLVAPVVPLPAAFWLFLSATVAIGGVMGLRAPRRS